MANNPETLYPGKITAASAAYPYGSARDVTITGDGTGTPWKASNVNDVYGFQQALLSAASVVPSGTPDSVTTSQYLEAFRKLTGQLTDGKKHQFLAAAIENTGGGWAFVNDSDYNQVGFSGINTLVGGGIELEYANNVTMASLTIAPNNVFANQGLVAGAVSEATKSTVTITAPMRFEVDPATATITAPYYWGSNITANTVDNVCTITHPTCEADNPPNMSDLGSTLVRTGIITNAYTTTSIELRGVGDISGYIKWDSGTTFSYEGKLKNAPTMVWDGTSYFLTVTHDETITEDLALTRDTAGYRPAIYALTPTRLPGDEFAIQFFNTASGAGGVLIAGLNSLVRFYFKRSGVAEVSDIIGDVAISRGHAPVDANDLISATGKFFVFGVMEIT